MTRKPAVSPAQAAWAVLVAGTALALATYAPGYMSYDSVAQLRAARTGIYDGWHPPLMSVLWGALDAVVPGPLGMLLFHVLLFWGGLALWVREGALRARAAAVIGLFPPVFAHIGTIWKDVGLGAALVFATALIARTQRTGSRVALVGALAALFYAVAARQNGAAAVLPLALWAGAAAVRALNLGLRRHAVPAGAVIGGTLVAMAFTVNASLVKAEDPRACPIYGVLLHDLAAVSIGAGELLLPPFQRQYAPGLTVDALRGRYVAGWFDPLVAPVAGQPPLLDVADTAEKCRQMKEAWWSAIPSHLGIYLRHRWSVFRNVLGVERVWYPFQETTVPNEFGFPAPERPWNRRVNSFFLALQYTPLFRGWPYLLLAIGCLVAAIRRGPGAAPAALAVSASGVAYVLPYFLFSPASDFRYCWWTVCASLLATGLLARRGAAAL
jgi:hypothetical protein